MFLCLSVGEKTSVFNFNRYNRAYDDLPLIEEEQVQGGMRRHHRKMVEGAW